MKTDLCKPRFLYDVIRTSGIEICRWTRAAKKTLDHHRQTVGWVHSCYDCTINIRTPCGRLLTLQDSGPLKAPLALSLTDNIKKMSSAIPVGEMVVKDAPMDVRYSGALHLIFSEAQEWDGRVPPTMALTDSEICAKADKLETWLMKHHLQSGLARLLPALRGSENNISSINTKVLESLKPLLDGCYLSGDSLLKVGSQVVGLGEGLTPSGDDLLVGLLAVLHMTGRMKNMLPVRTQSKFLDEVKVQTSDLSCEFIRSAVERNFSFVPPVTSESLLYPSQFS